MDLQVTKFVTKRFFICLLSILITLACNITIILAAEEGKHCKATKQYTNDYEPSTFPNSNNLLRSFGKSSLFCEEKILITGRVVDENCVPVADAKVYLWQADCQGYYPYEPLRHRIKHELIRTSHNSSFTGAGIATTNNNGWFSFITTIPAIIDGSLPYTNLRVEHYHLGKLQTKLFLTSSTIGNFSNEELINYKLPDNLTIYYFDIVLSGTTSKRY